MDKNQKNTASPQKSGGAKDSLKQDTSSKKMMDEKNNSKSEKSMPASSGKSATGGKTSKGK